MNDALHPVRRYVLSHLIFRVSFEGLVPWFWKPQDKARPNEWFMVKLCKIPDVPNPVERVKMTRQEVADMIRANRRANLGTSAKECGDFGVMKECPRTTLPEWKQRH